MIILQVVEYGGLLKRMLRKMSSQLNNPPFNYTIHPRPLHGNGSRMHSLIALYF